MSVKDQRLYARIDAYTRALWITRFHDSDLENWRRVQYLNRIIEFQRDWPKEAIEISKEVGWPNEDDIVSLHLDVGVDPLPLGGAGKKTN